MVILSLIGIVVAIALFIFMSVKKWPTYLVAIIAAIIVAVFDLTNPYTAVTTTYMEGAASFFSGYFLLFLMSALFGKVLDVTGCARRIALSLGGLTKRTKNPGFWAVLMLTFFYLLLIYIGVNGFVIAFTALCVGRELFSTNDVPWRLYPYGSAGMMAGTVLAGSYGTGNIVISTAFGVPTTAGVALSLIFVVIYLCILALVLKGELRTAHKNGEGFLPSGQAIAQANVTMDTQNLPSTWNAVICLLVPIVIIFTLQFPAVLSLLIAIVVCIVLNWKRIPDPVKTITDGLGSAIVPVINVCAVFGLAAVIENTTGFASISSLLQSLPGVLPAVVLGLLMSATVNNYYSFAGTYAEWMTAAGVSAATGARLMTMVSFAGMVPHSPGVINGILLTKLDFKAAVKSYLKACMIPGAIAISVCVILVSLGVFI